VVLACSGQDGRGYKLHAELPLKPPSPGWYPFNSFTGLEIGLQLIAQVYPEFTRSLTAKPVADIGCGDGDIALLFAHWSAGWALALAMSLPVARHRLNLDDRFEFPGHYGFALFLGALYHLQIPITFLIA